MSDNSNQDDQSPPPIDENGVNRSVLEGLSLPPQLSGSQSLLGDMNTLQQLASGDHGVVDLSTGSPVAKPEPKRAMSGDNPALSSGAFDAMDLPLQLAGSQSLLGDISTIERLASTDAPAISADEPAVFTSDMATVDASSPALTPTPAPTRSNNTPVIAIAIGAVIVVIAAVVLLL